MVGVMVSYLRLWLALWYHIYGYGWCYGIISTVMVGVMVSYLRFLMNSKKEYRPIILFQRIYYLSISLTGLPCHREPSIVLMSMVKFILQFGKICICATTFFDCAIQMYRRFLNIILNF